MTLVVGLAILAAAHWGLSWWRRRRTLARIRGEWGERRFKVRNMSAIASYHGGRTTSSSIESLDQRSWTDLDLDAVFAVLDRTESSIGQQQLYHRLRSLSAVSRVRQADREAHYTDSSDESGKSSRHSASLGPLIATAARLRRVHNQSHESLTDSLESDLPRLTRLRVLSGWLTRDSMTLDPLTAIVVEALNSLFLLDPTALFLGARELRQNGAALLRVLAAVGEIDSAIAIASYRAGTTEWTRPVLRSKGSTVNDTRLTASAAPTGGS